ncbi:polyprotein [Phytophthora megakarya]|nr:polyprotein [Phytophthora megakarya]
MKAHAPSFRVAFIKSDNAAEYTGGAFAAYCDKNDIVQEFSTPYSPQQNGKVERGNRVIVEMARSMMLGANLPTAYWADAVVCAGYVRNRCPTKVLDGKTPMEALFGKTPDISNLRVFGCKVQVLVPQEHRKKLDSKTRNGIFIGYATGGAYLVYIPRHGTGETITARSVVFYEDQFLPSEDGEEITISSQLDLLRLDQVSSTPSPRLDTVEEEKEDVAMVPSETATPSEMETPAQPTSGSFQPVGAARLEARLRGDPRREKATAPVRRSSRIPRPSQRKLEYDESHLSMEEVCAMVEERVLPASFDGTNVQDGFIDGELTPSDISNWALGVEPLNLDEVYESDDQNEWEHAMDDEIRSLLEKGTFEVVPLPPGRSAIKSKWVFKKKTLADGSLDKYKARIVAKGYSQRFGEDYTETFSPVVRHSTLRLVLVIVVARRMKRMQLDVKTAFLNSDLDEEIYLEPAEGYTNADGQVWRLRKALYGLKQASRSWYENLRRFLESQGFYQGEADYCLFSKGSADDDDLMIVLVYVDDMLVFATHDEDLALFKAAMEAAYEVNDFEDASYFLGLELQWSPSGDEVTIGQQKYAKTILERFDMDKAMPARTPMEERFRDQLFKAQEEISFRPRPAIGALLYLTVNTRPDMATAVRILAQEIETPTDCLKHGVEHVFRYLCSTQDFGLAYKSSAAKGLTVYCDAAFAVERNAKSATGYAIFYDGCLIEWGSKKQSMVTLSSTEAEYIAMGSGVQECIGISLVLKDLGLEVDHITVFEDNQGAQHLAESKAVTQRSRHIDTKYHWLREKVKEGHIRIKYCPTAEMIADHFTKALGVTKFQYFRDRLAVRRVGVLERQRR